MVQKRELGQTDPSDILACLPRADGRGFWICGREAETRLFNISVRCIENSPATKGKLAPGDVLPHLKKSISNRLLTGKHEITKQEVEKVVREARGEAVKSIDRITHYIPCILAEDNSHQFFSIGPVTFINKNNAISEIEQAYQGKESDEFINAVSYYRKFNWIAKITVGPCSPSVSEKKAHQVLSSVFDALTAIFSSQKSIDMGFKHIPPPSIEASSITIASDSVPKITTHISWNGHRLQKDWLSEINNLGYGDFLHSVACFLDDDIYESTDHPLDHRFLNALKWYGDGAREPDPGARIVKFATAIETLLLTDRWGDKTRVFKERGTALFTGATRLSDLTISKDFKRVYDLRSDVIHVRVNYGEIKWADAHKTEDICRYCLFHAIMLFTEIGLSNDHKLSDIFNWLVKTNKGEAL